MKKFVLTAILFVALAGVASAQSPTPQKTFTWQGLYLGYQLVAPVNRAPSQIKPSNFAVTLNAIVGVRKNYSIQFQFIQSIDGRTSLFRVAVDRRIW